MPTGPSHTANIICFPSCPTERKSGEKGSQDAHRRLAVAVFTAALAGAGCLVAPLPALALMAPQYYEQARREAASVIVIKVANVEGPGPEGYGTCAVRGTVAKVERGAAYKAGQAVSLGVPCARPGVQPPIGGTIWQGVEALKVAPYGRAWLDAEGKVVLSQYQRLEAAP